MTGDMEISVNSCHFSQLRELHMFFVNGCFFFCENRQEHELFTPRGNQNRWITDDVSISPPTLWQSNMAWWKRPTIRRYSHIGATYGYRFQYELKQVLPWPGRLHAILWTAELGTKTVTETLASHIGGWNFPKKILKKMEKTWNSSWRTSDLQYLGLTRWPAQILVPKSHAYGASDGLF